MKKYLSLLIRDVVVYQMSLGKMTEAQVQNLDAMLREHDVLDEETELAITYDMFENPER